MQFMLVVSLLLAVGCVAKAAGDGDSDIAPPNRMPDAQMVRDYLEWNIGRVQFRKQQDRERKRNADAMGSGKGGTFGESTSDFDKYAPTTDLATMRRLIKVLDEHPDRILESGAYARLMGEAKHHRAAVSSGPVVISRIALDPGQRGGSLKDPNLARALGQDIRLPRVEIPSHAVISVRNLTAKRVSFFVRMELCGNDNFSKDVRDDSYQGVLGAYEESRFSSREGAGMRAVRAWVSEVRFITDRRDGVDGEVWASSFDDAKKSDLGLAKAVLP